VELREFQNELQRTKANLGETQQDLAIAENQGRETESSNRDGIFEK
jgi:hypothetical protein